MENVGSLVRNDSIASLLIAFKPVNEILKKEEKVGEEKKVESRKEEGFVLKKPIESEKEKHVNKIAYNLIKVNKLREICSKIGLNSKGKKLDLVKIHKEFLNRFYANKDSLEPLPFSQLVEQVNQENRVLFDLGKQTPKNEDSRKLQQKFKKLKKEAMESRKRTEKSEKENEVKICVSPSSPREFELETFANNSVNPSPPKKAKHFSSPNLKEASSLNEFSEQISIIERKSQGGQLVSLDD